MQNDAISLGELDQRIDALLRLVGARSKCSRIALKPTGASLATPSVPRKSRSPSARHRAAVELELQRGGDGLQRDAGAGDERLEQHVAGAQLDAGAAGRRVKAGDRQRAAGLDLAGDRLVVDGSAALSVITALSGVSR